MKTITVNDKTYNTKPIDINALCVFEDNGLSLADIGNIGKKPILFSRAYLAFVGNMDAERAGLEINEHMIKGGNLEDIINAFADALNESDFFQAIIKNAEKNGTKSKTTKE